MMEGQPSQTALHVAAARAAHLRFDPPPHLLEDAVAERLLGEDGAPLIQSYGDDGSWLLVENRLAIPLRARYVEDRLAAAYRTGVRQLLILGAGLDSYAFRMPPEQTDLRVYEVDHPSTQGWKIARIAELGWEVPASLTFVACDFERQTVSEVLRDSAFDADQPAIASWMGVVYYLTPQTALRALRDLRGLLACGSEVVFDYQYPLEDLPERYRGVPEVLNRYLDSVGEPQHNRYRPHELESVILEAGFEAALLEARDAIHDRYYRPLDSPIPMSGRFGLAIARRDG